MIDFNLRGKVALVSGASGNLGGAIATAFALQGVSVGLLYGSVSSCERTEALARRLSCLDGVRACALHADLHVEKLCSRAVETAFDEFGSLDILVNNAGIFSESDQVSLSEKMWDEVMDTNVKGLWRMCRLSFEHLASSRGAVVNLCSINAFRPGFGGTVHYDASKGAVASYTRSLAAEWARHGIRVNAVAPGLVDAKRLHETAADLVERYERRAALGRLVTAEDVASIVCFLASDASRAMTGEIVSADCGYGMM